VAGYLVINNSIQTTNLKCPLLAESGHFDLVNNEKILLKLTINKVCIKILLLIFLFIMNSVVSAADDKVNYNPTLCKTDAEDMVYFALGRTVFRTHYQEPIFIRGMSEEKRALLPKRPDSSDPEGCPDNPIWGSGFTFAYHYERVTNEKTMKMYADKLSFIYIPKNKEWSGQISHENSFKYVKEKYDLCRNISDELIGCFVQLNDGSAQEDWEAFAYQAKKELYQVPFDREYTLSCHTGVVEGDRTCNTSYRYYEDVGITYRFRTNNIPISEIIKFDRNLRGRIDEMRVNDYAWPDK
jgi:hypothetical protein